MTLQEECRLSYYEEVRQLSQNHNVFLVRHQESQQLFVRKVLTAYNLEIYHYLKDHPIDNTPKIYDLIEDEGRLIVIEEYIAGETLQIILMEQMGAGNGRYARIIRKATQVDPKRRYQSVMQLEAAL